jgi:hypothetical protein
LEAELAGIGAALMAGRCVVVHCVSGMMRSPVVGNRKTVGWDGVRWGSFWHQSALCPSRAFAGVEEHILQLFVRMPGQAFDHEVVVIFFDLFGKGSVFMLPIDDERVD